MNSFRKTLALSIVACLAPACIYGQQYTVTTAAGKSRVAGYFGDGEAASNAQLYFPTRVSLDSKGNFYIADYYVNRIRKVTAADGKITSIAGNGISSYEKDGISATDTPISDVHGIAVDSSGNVYIADTSNSRIRKIDDKGIITTFAGTGTRGFTGDGAAAASARLWFPSGLAFDSSGNLYVADHGNYTVRKIAGSGGTITTVAGTGVWGNSGDGGPASRAQLGAPSSVALDSAGNIYIGDSANNNIRKITTDGNIRTILTGYSVQSLSVDGAGNVYFVDGSTARVWKLLPNGTVLTIGGTGQTGSDGEGVAATSAQFDHPAGVASDAAGNVYVADTGNSIIRLLKPVSFSAGALTNAASGAQTAVAPGEIVAVFGDKIGPASLTQLTITGGNVPDTIANTQIFFNGVPAPLIYVSAGLGAAIVPSSLAGQSSVDVAVKYNGVTSATTTFPMVATSPGIFTADSTGSGQAAAVNVAEGTTNKAATPVKIGGFLSLYITGAGALTPASPDNKVTPSVEPLPRVIAPVEVTIGGRPAVVSYAGAVPTAVAGLVQLNVQVPTGISTGAAIPVTVKVGGVSAQSGVTIAVAP